MAGIYEREGQNLKRELTSRWFGTTLHVNALLYQQSHKDEVEEDDPDYATNLPPEVYCHSVLKWIIPGSCFCFFAFLSMWWLHVGTYYYVHEMELKEKIYKVNEQALVEYESLHTPFLRADYPSPGIHPKDISYGSLQDISAVALGYEEVNMKILDRISALLPAMWFFICIGLDDVVVWTKTITINCFLLGLKGLFGFMTIVPDSSGWASCQARLNTTDKGGIDGIKLMKETIGSVESGFWSVFWNTGYFEISSRLPGGPGKFPGGVRFCADMMFSGHTFFTCLYALSLVELVRRHNNAKWLQNPKVFWGFLVFIYILAIVEQAVEIWLVLLNRFHYIMDVVMAVILTLLFYTNGTISIFAKQWQYYDFSLCGMWNPNVVNLGMLKKLRHELKHKGVWSWVRKQNLLSWHSLSDGETWTPCCCVPFCFFMGKYHIIDDQTWLTFSGKRSRFSGTDGCCEQFWEVGKHDTDLDDYESETSRSSSDDSDDSHDALKQME